MMYNHTPQNGKPERRKFTRVPFATTAHGVSPVAGEGDVRVLEISRVGIRFVSPCALTSGQPVSVIFGDRFFEERPIALGGTTVWSMPEDDGFATGVVFMHPNADSIVCASELLYTALSDFGTQPKSGMMTLVGE